MAGITIRRHGLKLAVCRALVTGIAVHRGMRPGKRKTIVMLLHLLDRYLPSPHRVALFAVRSQLPFVDVRVAVLATRAHIA